MNTLNKFHLGGLTSVLLIAISNTVLANPVEFRDSDITPKQTQWQDQGNIGVPAIWQDTNRTSTTGSSWQSDDNAPSSPRWRENPTTTLPSRQWQEREAIDDLPTAAPLEVPQWSAPTATKTPSFDQRLSREFLPHTPPTSLSPPAAKRDLLQTDYPVADLDNSTQDTQPLEPLTDSLKPAQTTIMPTKIGQTSAETTIAQEATTPTQTLKTPLSNRQFQQPTAQHLGQGEVVFNVGGRIYFLPNFSQVTDSLITDETTAYPNFGVSWGITDSSQLTIQWQQVDSIGIGRQGPFQVVRRDGDQEGTLEFKQKLWQNDSETQALSAVLSLSIGQRGFEFSQNGFVVLQEQKNSPVPALQVPFTATLGDRWNLTLSPTVAFFGSESALFLRRAPVENPGSFGTTFGFTTAVSYEVNPRLTLWGDAFVPLTGNNSISRDSGKPAQAIAFNAGLRYMINPKLGIDLFASNTLGSVGALALTADRDLVAIGTNLVFMPDFLGGNRRYPSSFDGQETYTGISPTTHGLNFLNGGTLRSGGFNFDVEGGSQSVFTALRFGFLQDFEGGIYLNYVFGDRDESEQGISGKIGFLNQKQGDPLTVSLAVTTGLTSEAFANFRFNNRNAFELSRLTNGVPFFYPGADEGNRSKLYVITASIPIQYEFDNGAALWFTPMMGYVQRLGTELAGFNVGGTLPLGKDFRVLGEVGANFAGEGNGFDGQRLKDIIPWTAAIRYNFDSLLGINPNAGERFTSYLELYVTNRVGFTPWLHMRVLDQNDTAVGGGLSISF